MPCAGLDLGYQPMPPVVTYFVQSSGFFTGSTPASSTEFHTYCTP